MTRQNLVFEPVAGVLSTCCGEASTCCAIKLRNTSDVLQNRSVAQSVARKIISTQCLEWVRNSATLLLLKIYNCVYVYTYAHVYRVSSRGCCDVWRRSPPHPAVGPLSSVLRSGRFNFSTINVASKAVLS